MPARVVSLAPDHIEEEKKKHAIGKLGLLSPTFLHSLDVKTITDPSESDFDLRKRFHGFEAVRQRLLRFWWVVR